MSQAQKKNQKNKVVIYFDKERTSMQVITPTPQFDRNWHQLVLGATNGKYHSYQLQ